jgi:cell surface protein SprA
MNLDLRQYGRVAMFVHAESTKQGGTDIRDNDLNAVIRIGNDYVSNYYEIKIPLKVTQWGSSDSLSVWPEQNNLDFDLNLLTTLKSRRNNNGTSPSQYFQQLIEGRQYAILGNPNLGEVRGFFLGVENGAQELVDAEVWFNELRLQRLNEKGGYAALGRVDLRWPI